MNKKNYYPFLVHFGCPNDEVRTTSTPVGYNVTTQPVKQKTRGGKGVGPVQSNGSKSAPTFQTTKPAANGTIKWKKGG